MLAMDTSLHISYVVRWLTRNSLLQSVNSFCSLLQRHILNLQEVLLYIQNEVAGNWIQSMLSGQTYVQQACSEHGQVVID
jgi:hypothetical protein